MKYYLGIETLELGTFKNKIQGKEYSSCPVQSFSKSVSRDVEIDHQGAWSNTVPEFYPISIVVAHDLTIVPKLLETFYKGKLIPSLAFAKVPDDDKTVSTTFVYEDVVITGIQFGINNNGLYYTINFIALDQKIEVLENGSLKIKYDISIRDGKVLDNKKSA